METTTDLQELKAGARYTWGRLIEIHEIFEYSIVEYESDSDKSEIRYAPYIHGKNCARAYITYDRAIAGAIAYKYEGCNHHADSYFIKGIEA